VNDVPDKKAAEAGSTRDLSFLLDVASGALAFGLKFLTLFEVFSQLLPLPEELATIGWVLTIVLIVLGVVAARIVRKATSAARARWVGGISLAFGLIVFPGLFWLVESAWKRSPRLVADFVYHWGEPLVYALAFGFVATGLALLLFEVRHWLTFLKPAKDNG